MVTRTIEVYDSALMTVASSDGSLAVGSSIINNSNTPDGTVFTFSGGTPQTVSVDDTNSDHSQMEDDDAAHHTIIDGGGLVAAGTGVEAESKIVVQELDGAGNPIGNPITITVFSKDGVTGDVWGFHSDAPLKAGVDYVKISGNSTGTTSYSQIESQPVCYAGGTLIDTILGARPVEDLRPGERVLTVDRGAVEIRWVHRAEQPLEQTPTDGKPVLITAGALGQGKPEADLIVSPQHRILIGGAGQLPELGGSEAFAPAKALTDLPGVRFMRGKRLIRWHHFACDRHEVVTANGALSESVLLGAMMLKALPEREVRDMRRLFGGVAGPPLNGPVARKCLSVGEVRRLIKTARVKVIGRRGASVDDWDHDLEVDHERAPAGSGPRHMPRRAVG